MCFFQRPQKSDPKGRAVPVPRSTRSDSHSLIRQEMMGKPVSGTREIIGKPIGKPKLIQNFTGLVCWGKSEPETMVFTIKYRAFRLKFSHNPILWELDQLVPRKNYTENVQHVSSYDFPKSFLCFRSSKNPLMSRHGKLVLSRVNGSEINFPFVSPGAWTSFYSCRALSGVGRGSWWMLGVGYGLWVEIWNMLKPCESRISDDFCAGMFDDFWWFLMICWWFLDDVWWFLMIFRCMILWFTFGSYWS